MTPLRMGIVGCGHIAKRHASILATLDEVRLVGFYAIFAIRSIVGGGATARRAAVRCLSKSFTCSTKSSTNR
jgi:predicted dehydrogenase